MRAEGLSLCHEVCPWGWESLWRSQGPPDRMGIFSMSFLAPGWERTPKGRRGAKKPVGRGGR